MDKDTISGYVRQFHSPLFRLAYSYVRNREDAEDITQEAFMRLLRFEKSFPTAEDAKAWLMRVTINLSKDILKSRWRTGRDELSEEIPCATKEEYAVQECISRLEPMYRGIIHLFYYEGYSVKEIASICRISRTAVTTRLSRARKQLKAMLTDEERKN